MLYVLYGSDTVRARQKLETLVEGMREKKPDSSILRFTADTFDPSRLPELLHGQGLFERRYIVVLEHLLSKESKEEAKEALLGNLKAFEASDNIFLLYEGELTKAVAEKLGKRAAKLQEFSREKQEKKKFEVFALTDALGRRDRKTLWVLYHKARRAGVGDEEVHGILFWQVRSMLLARSCATAQISGQNPFVFRKASAFARNFKAGELERLSEAFVQLYHEARRGLVDFDTGLERLILTF